MRLAGNTITIFNAVHDAAEDLDDYIPTVITGTTWHAQVVTAVDGTGLKAASKYVVRVPLSADTSGKAYADPVAYASAADKSALFTVRAGDMIARGAIEERLTPAQVKERYADSFTVLGVTDASRAPREPHFLIVGV